MRRLDQRVFKILIQEFDDAHGVKAHRVVNNVFTQAPELLADVQQLEQVARLE